MTDGNQPTTTAPAAYLPPTGPASDGLAATAASLRDSAAVVAGQAASDLAALASQQHQVLSDSAVLAARCAHLRAVDRCPGRCVVSGLTRPGLPQTGSTDRLRRRS